MEVKNLYPIYIISKGRYKNILTSKVLEYMGVNYYIIVESEEHEKYKEVCKGEVLILPESYKKDYDTFWHDGDERTGPGPARNFAWDHSIKNGFSHHWVMDDNIDAFHRLNKNEKWEVSTGTIFRCMEDFVNRYENIAISGPNYYSFCKSTDKVPPFIINTRIYSCLLIKNDIPYRWRGRYNEDTDLSIRVLKDGYCTIQFNAFLQGKVTTQRMKGGNTKEFYKEEGTLNKSRMLYEMHPDITKVVYKFNRWHHVVNYKVFYTLPIRRKNLLIENKTNNYGMELVKKEHKK